MEMLRLVVGDPKGSGYPSDYEFEKITVEGEEAIRLQKQLDEWILVDDWQTDMLTSSGDYYGCGGGMTDTTSLLKLADSCFIHDGELLGYKQGNMLLFINGATVGRTTYSYSDDEEVTKGKYYLKRNPKA